MTSEILAWAAAIFNALAALAFAWRMRRIEADRDQLKAIATKDSLTGLENRRGYNARLRAAVAHALRNKQPISILSIDLNDFKGINDTRGHAFGDLVLKALADMMRGASLRASDVLARPGGDEFAMVLPYADEDGARIVAERLVELVSKCHVMDRRGDPVSFSISIGGTCLRGVGGNLQIEEVVMDHPEDHSVGLVERAEELLLRRTDDKLYLAKRRKTDGVSPIEVTGPELKL